MDEKQRVSRRNFVGGVATAVGYLTIKPSVDLWAQGTGRAQQGAQQQVGPNAPRERISEAEYDALAKLANNENPYGPPDSVMQAMTKAFKYSNRYGYPDGGITEEIAKHHGVKPENVLVAAGSGEILDVVGSTFASR